MRSYKLTLTDKILIIGIIVSFIIIISVGASIGKPVLVDDWDVEKVNYFIMKLAEVSVGFIVSTFFYYLLVVIEHRKYTIVRKRIGKLLGIAKVHQERVVSNLLRETNYPKYYDEIVKEDIRNILVNLDHMIENNNENVIGVIDHWYRYTLYVERYLTKVLTYYKENLTEEALVNIEELLESLYLDSIKRLPATFKNWGNAKVENIAINMSEFDEKIRKVDSLI